MHKTRSLTAIALAAVLTISTAAPSFAGGRPRVTANTTAVVQVAAATPTAGAVTTGSHPRVATARTWAKVGTSVKTAWPNPPQYVYRTAHSWYTEATCEAIYWSKFGREGVRLVLVQLNPLYPHVKKCAIRQW